ncbi:hypothetical protein PQR21_04810 [Paraburkholderia nemoris]
MFDDPAAAFDLLDWRAKFGIGRMCADRWQWPSSNLPEFAQM